MVPIFTFFGPNEPTLILCYSCAAKNKFTSLLSVFVLTRSMLLGKDLCVFHFQRQPYDLSRSFNYFLCAALVHGN